MPHSQIKIALAQVNFLMGDIEGNMRRMIKFAGEAKRAGAALIAFPELGITGYPPQDLLLRQELYERVNKALSQLKEECRGIDLLVGYPEQEGKVRYNAAAFIRDGKILANYRKQCLPNYGVFDDRRYFTPGSAPCVVEVKGVFVGVLICEDIWYPEPIQQSKKAGAELCICLNASPFDRDKAQSRKQTLKSRVQESGLPVAYVQWVGGHDDLVYDGGSMVLDQAGTLCQDAGFFKESLLIAPFKRTKEGLRVVSGPLPPEMPTEARIYNALVLGVRDYIQKSSFDRALIGLSGGIDSALTLAIAVDALGKDNVTAVMMPSRFTSDLSIQAADEQARLLGVKLLQISIEPTFQAFLSSLGIEEKDITSVPSQNIQARCRGVILMALSNQTGAIVLATGNKSELAVGYSTLYGDLVGGFCVLKDVLKTFVYKLAHYRNSLSPAILKNIIDREPTAELAPGQKDQDTLPPYPVLDKIIEGYIENNKSIEDLVAEGLDEATVRKTTRSIDQNEYKRRQSATGLRVTSCAFERERRYPIVSGFRKVN